MEIDRKKNFRFSEWTPESGTPDSGNTDSEETKALILVISSSELHNEFFNAVMKTYAKHKQCGILLQLLQQRYRSPELESHLEEPSLVKPYFQREEDKFRFRKNNPTPPAIVGVEDSHGPVKKINKARKISLNGKDQRQYLVRFKKQTADKDRWFKEDSIPDGNLNLRRFRASRRTEQSHQ
ncbi:hypothetical protein O181_082698 [Austropuccinia psidii MF-1]|uniref:Uncharacterized protein n=1 Tax=Austropuccinia psidii MF-1 TaxID=1389203 RepID=A0A9Q3FSA3_9BASI|nr:hypothetical protein [Austropuccinia psidii MF-1]